MPQPSNALVVVAHGTRSTAGQETVRRIAAAVAERLPGVLVRDAYVDVQEPTAADVVSELAAECERVVVVPLLLSTGYHVQVDVARAVRPFPNAVSTGPLGPHPLLADALIDRARGAGASDSDGLVVAVAGSSRPETVVDATRIAELVAERRPGPTSIGYAAKAEPPVAEAVLVLRDTGSARVVVAPYLVAEGFFHDQLFRLDADLVAAPLGAHPLLIDVVVERFQRALEP